jgi:RNA polymerase sigma factor (sigma-70 family)
MESIIDLVHEHRRSSDAAGRIRAVEKIILAAAPSLTLFLMKRSEFEIADLRQSIFLAIVRGMDGFRGNSDREFWAWCYQISRNILGKYHQTKHTRLTVFLDPEELNRLVDGSAEREAISSEERVVLDDALSLLKEAKPECFEMLWRRFILGFEITEIAADLGIAFDTARMKINRCLHFTRALLKES